MVTEEDSSPPNPANPAELVQSGSPRLSISDSYEPKVADSTKSVPVTSASPINYPTISGDVSTQSVSPAIVTTKRQYDQSSLTVKSLPSKITCLDPVCELKPFDQTNLANNSKLLHQENLPGDPNLFYQANMYSYEIIETIQSSRSAPVLNSKFETFEETIQEEPPVSNDCLIRPDPDTPLQPSQDGSNLNHSETLEHCSLYSDFPLSSNSGFDFSPSLPSLTAYSVSGFGEYCTKWCSWFPAEDKVLVACEDARLDISYWTDVRTYFSYV